MDLKPKVLVIGQGLWYGISHPPTKFENYYRNDLRRQLDKLVGILKKVEETFIRHPVKRLISETFSVQNICDFCQAIPLSKDGGVAGYMRIRGQNE